MSDPDGNTIDLNETLRQRIHSRGLLEVPNKISRILVITADRCCRWLLPRKIHLAMTAPDSRRKQLTRLSCSSSRKKHNENKWKNRNECATLVSNIV